MGAGSRVTWISGGCAWPRRCSTSPTPRSVYAIARQRLAADIALNFAELDSLPIKAVQWIQGGASGRVVLDIQNIRGGYGHTRGIVDADLGPSTAFGVALSDVRAHIDFDDARDAQISGVELGLAGWVRLAGARCRARRSWTSRSAGRATIGPSCGRSWPCRGSRAAGNWQAG